MTPAESLLAEWLSGTTCGLRHRKLLSIQWQSKCGRFVVLKHKGHSEYCGRGSGTSWCGTYFHMFDVTHPQPFDSWGQGRGNSLMSANGRWTKKHQADAETLAAGIV